MVPNARDDRQFSNLCPCGDRGGGRIAARWVVLGVMLAQDADILRAQPKDMPSQEVLSQIMAGWERRRERLPTVRYELAGLRTWFRGAFNDPTAPPTDAGDNPHEDVADELTRTVLLDFEGNRHRIEWDHPEYYPAERRLYRIRCLNVCDGESTRSRIFENTGPPVRSDRARPHVDLMIQRGELPVGILNNDYLPLFLGHGIVPYEGIRPTPGELAPPLRVEHLTYRGEAEYRGRTCAIVRTPEGRLGSQELWVDVARDAAVLQIISRPEAPMWMLDIRYRETEDGWLTDGWTRTEFSVFDAGLKFQEEVVVTEIEPGPQVTDADFQVPAEPGMYVQEVVYITDPQSGRVTGESDYYRVEPDRNPTPLDPRLRPLPRPGGLWTTRWRFLAAGNLLVLVVLALYCLRSRIRGRRD